MQAAAFSISHGRQLDELFNRKVIEPMIAEQNRGRCNGARLFSVVMVRVVR